MWEVDYEDGSWVAAWNGDWLPIPCLILLILAGVFGLFMSGLVKLAKKGTRYSS